MNAVKFSGIAAVLMLLPAPQALAFNFGFVRVPDWMDMYIGVLCAVSVAAWLGLLATKPRGVPIRELPNVQISPLAGFFRWGLLIAFMGMMALVFLGMGLRRYAEFQAG